MTCRRRDMHGDQGSETTTLGVSPQPTVDGTQREPLTRASSFQASEPQRKGVREPGMVGCTSVAGPDAKPVPGCADTQPLRPGTHVDTTEELACLFTFEEDGNGCFSLRLSREDNRPSLPGNAPCYLRRCKGDSHHDSFCRDRPGRPRLEKQGESGKPGYPGKEEPMLQRSPSGPTETAKNRD